MMRTLILGAFPVWAVVTAFMLLIACSVKPAVTVTDADNGSRVEIATGDVLAVSLEAQLGTGFGWRVAGESEVLALNGDPEQVSRPDQKPGGPEYQTFKFKATQKGQADLKFHYAEGWKKHVQPLKEFSITVIVK